MLYKVWSHHRYNMAHAIINNNSDQMSQKIYCNVNYETHTSRKFGERFQAGALVYSAIKVWAAPMTMVHVLLKKAFTRREKQTYGFKVYTVRLCRGSNYRSLQTLSRTRPIWLSIGVLANCVSLPRCSSALPWAIASRLIHMPIAHDRNVRSYTIQNIRHWVINKTMVLTTTPEKLISLWNFHHSSSVILQ